MALRSVRSRPFRPHIALYALLLLAAPPSSAETWRVPSQHPYIFGAVDSASFGDTVLVEPGTYYRERDKELPDGVIM